VLRPPCPGRRPPRLPRAELQPARPHAASPTP